MKRLSTLIALAVFGLAPTIGGACEYNDAATSASAAPPAQLVSAPAPAATRAPASAMSKAFAPKAKQAAAEVKAPIPDQTIAAASKN